MVRGRAYQTLTLGAMVLAYVFLALRVLEISSAPWPLFVALLVGLHSVFLAIRMLSRIEELDGEQGGDTRRKGGERGASAYRHRAGKPVFGDREAGSFRKYIYPNPNFWGTMYTVVFYVGLQLGIFEAICLFPSMAILSGLVERWHWLKGTYGRGLLRSAWTMLVCNMKCSKAMLFLALMISGPVLYLLVLVRNRAGFSTTWLVLMAVSGLIGYILHFASPPSVLVLTTSTERDLWEGMKNAVMQLRAVALLSTDRTPWRRQMFATWDNLRTSDHLWRPMVEQLMGLSTLVVLDARARSAAIEYEIGRIIALGKTDKAIFVVGPNGESPALDAQCDRERLVDIQTVAEGGVASAVVERLDAIASANCGARRLAG